MLYAACWFRAVSCMLYSLCCMMSGCESHVVCCMLVSGLWHGRVSSPLDDAVYDRDFLPCWKDDELVGHSSRENLLQLELLPKPPELYWSLGGKKTRQKSSGRLQ